MNYIALIPTYEPDNKIIKLVDELIDNNFKVIIVNDGSSSKYNPIFDKINKNATLLSYDTNMGKGYALKYGYKYIKDNYKEYIVVTMDSDGQHKVSDALKLCNYVNEHKNILCLGKRLRSNKTPFKSRVGNAITKFVFFLASHTNIYDTQTGLRCFSDKLMNYNLKIPGNRFEYEMNVLLNASKNKIKIKEIEIETIYFNENKGSHFNPIKDSFKIYKEIIKFSLSSITSFILDYLLYIIFNIFNKAIISNILARIISSIYNYSLNRKYVFKSHKNIYIEATKYFSLALLILILNTTLLHLLLSINFNKYLAKLLVEITLYILSFIVQKLFIFKSNN